MKIIIRPIGESVAKGLKAEPFVKAMKDEMRGGVKDGITDDFQKTVKGWKNPPSFKFKMDARPSVVSVIVEPTGKKSAVEKYIGINEGIPAHIIRPRRRKALSFKTKYYASTSPRRIWSRPYRRGGDTAFATVVNHPGVEARLFDEQIAIIWKSQLRVYVQRAIDKEAKRVNS